ncbi:MAG TPA: holo-[acyl-carrier-protein] synthase [Peptococcaceae bacterium]|nr:holo-[acyl-carrier-protein] synthase [Peptococcaceae bacterium]
MPLVGIDIIEIERIERALARHPRFLDRVFTSREQAYCRGKRRPGASLAARWAAKEAVFKVLGLGWGQVGWKDVEILVDDRGRPQVVLHGRGAEAARQRGLLGIDVSLSHHGSMAVAVAIADGR